MKQQKPPMTNKLIFDSARKFVNKNKDYLLIKDHEEYKRAKNEN